jgi:methylase of polypeptide subunit release factors
MPNFLIPGKEHFSVAYDSCEDGGGTWFGQEYVDIMQSRYPKQFSHCLEWCSGPGFIGFALLAHGIIDRLTLMDRYPLSGTSVQITCSANRCSDKVEFYNIDRVANLPKSARFDLVIGNPPHYLQCPGNENYQRIAVDPNWQAHREFYENIAYLTTSDSIILIQENQAGSTSGPAEFFPMIILGNLRPTAYWTSDRYFDVKGPTQIYYIESRPI